MANEIQQSFSSSLMDKLVSVDGALPKNFNKERFVQNAIALCNDRPELQKFSKAQIISGIMKAAYLDLDAYNGECYLIPYGNTLNFQISYKGKIKFVKKYSIRPILDIYAKVVREGDEFVEKITDGHPSIDFKPIPFNNGEIVGVFAVVSYTDGGMDYEVMTIREVNDVRNNYSKQANGSTWKKSFSEMAKKTVLSRLCKHIETDFESVNAKQAWEDGSDSNIATVQKSDEIVDVFANTNEVPDIEIKEVIDNE